MKRILLNAEHTGLSDNILQELRIKLSPEIKKIAEAKNSESYTASYASINLPFDVVLHAQIKKAIAAKKALEPTLLVVIGIGGSNLGTMAVLQALFGRFYNEQQPDIKVFFADTLDTDYIEDMLLLAEQELQKGHAILLNVVTKSGTTTETVANFYIFCELLRSFYPQDYHKYIVVTTDKDSPLYVCAREQEMLCLEIPKQVGGRYSIFSAVGLFPLGVLGINIDELIKGAQQMVEQCIVDDAQNSAACSASVRYQLYTQGINIHDLFLFAVDLENVGKWYRQLMGESLGKEYDIQGARVEIGITPTVSLGTIDLHSVAQLYLGGPRDKLTVFVDVIQTRSHCYVPTYKECADVGANIQDKSVSSLMHAILTGVYRAYGKTDRPFMQLMIPEKSALYIGQLLQYMMLEMMYLGALLEVNPFDQPNVELYKQETRKILENE